MISLKLKITIQRRFKFINIFNPYEFHKHLFLLSFYKLIRFLILIKLQLVLNHKIVKNPKHKN